MPVTFTCPKCTTLLRVSRKKIGETVGCPKCDTLMVVPELVEEPAPAEEPASVKDETSTGEAEAPAPASAPSPAPSASAGVKTRPAAEGRGISAKALLQEGAGLKPAPSPSPTSPATATAPAPSAAASAPAPQSAPSTLADDGDEEYDDEELISEFIVYDDSGSQTNLPDASGEEAKGDAAKPEAAAGTAAGPGTPAAAAAPGPAPAATTPPASATPAPPPAPSFEVPPGMVLVPRMALLILTLLFMGVTVGSYSVGYMFGAGDAPQGEANEPTGPLHNVIVEGRLTYITPAGSVSGDAGAILVALPQGADPDPKLPHVGLRPEDVAALGLSSEMAALVKKAGGNVVQADRDGAFLFTVPKPGKYFLLGISRKADRAEGRGMRADDLAIFARFFGNPELLVGKKKYLLKLETLDRMGAMQTLSFGAADD